MVVFDLDDTLYKEIDFLKSAYRHIASLVSNVNAPEKDVYQLMIETYQKGGNAFETVVQKYKFRLFSVQWMLGVYRNHKPYISLDDDTRNTLDQLKANGVTIGLISDGRQMQQQNKVDALGLETYMDKSDIIINDKEERHKPDIRSFRTFVDKYGKGCDYWYVGDNTKKDFKGPNNLGWSTVCLLNDGRNIHPQDFDHLPSILPKYRINKMSDILSIV